MSLNESRRIVKRLHRAGYLSKIRQDKVACDLADPDRSPMCGHYVVDKMLPGGDVEVLTSSPY